MGVINVELMSEESSEVSYPMKDDWVLLNIWMTGMV